MHFNINYVIPYHITKCLKYQNLLYSHCFTPQLHSILIRIKAVGNELCSCQAVQQAVQQAVHSHSCAQSSRADAHTQCKSSACVVRPQLLNTARAFWDFRFRHKSRIRFANTVRPPNNLLPSRSPTFGRAAFYLFHFGIFSTTPASQSQSLQNKPKIKASPI